MQVSQVCNVPFLQAIRGPLSLEVLRNLLQLAVGSKCFSCTVEADLAWELGHQQQDHWHRAAWEAVRLFSFQELGEENSQWLTLLGLVVPAVTGFKVTTKS